MSFPDPQVQSQAHYYRTAPILTYSLREFDGHALRVDTVLNFHLARGGRGAHTEAHPEHYIHTLYVDGRLYQDAYSKELGIPHYVDAWMREEGKHCGGWKRDDWSFIKSRTSVKDVREFVAQMVRYNYNKLAVKRSEANAKTAAVFAAIEEVANL